MTNKKIIQDNISAAGDVVAGDKIVNHRYGVLFLSRYAIYGLSSKKKYIQRTNVPITWMSLPIIISTKMTIRFELLKIN